MFKPGMHPQRRDVHCLFGLARRKPVSGKKRYAADSCIRQCPRREFAKVWRRRTAEYPDGRFKRREPADDLPVFGQRQLAARPCLRRPVPLLRAGAYERDQPGKCHRPRCACLGRSERAVQAARRDVLSDGRGAGRFDRGELPHPGRGAGGRIIRHQSGRFSVH